MIVGFDQNTDFVEGAAILIDKPLEWSSFDVVKKIRNILSRKLGIKKIKVGHAGTLDPLASGLMIISTGRATKQIQSFQDLPKKYDALLKLGESTPSFDLETVVDQKYPVEHITETLVMSTLESYKGELMQIPPVYSAKRQGGVRAYDMARKGKEIKMRPQLINIYELDVINFEIPDLRIHVTCSKGTYIRSLAQDIGTDLKSGAHLRALRRTQIGEYSVGAALSLEKFEETINNM
jgi:tRNA pseudouridine55 synthase